jgi:RimJ/RimL family protein N-acetyltransferase
MLNHGPADEVIRLRAWADDDAAWYAEASRDPVIQRFTTESPTLDADQVLAAIHSLRASDLHEGFVIRDAATGARLGNIALQHDGESGEVSYWITAEARGQGIATRALVLFSTWSFQTTSLSRLTLSIHRDNIASQKAAVRAGYTRDPQRDRSRVVKGSVWPMLGYVLHRPDPPGGSDGGGGADVEALGGAG